ncbi:MAG: hypothetical protein COU09_01070 [Candidatus Harrisonbacteria bacterium CG10_big_fil_rev_8_21_14_0_10_44_23]|uniref:Type II secretion system protein GspF domain-containing protein n=1 Tax=Candidatus Harrisonbacteria bacterium CG10_big_fil_rev_8_21_14_0_10_44_23 TaxID=1974585 RepID=A0A2H0USN1_9BACT|nr:MAG: hypothetical protein COU09_01070 [Candidatus Harrisonbacteria bacterium CG10_big_fil_rev_8_21_14_0_10_44_23]
MEDIKTPPPQNTEAPAPAQTEENKISPEQAVAQQDGGVNVKIFKGGVDFKNMFVRVPLQDRVMFAKHMSVGLHAGMTMQKSLELIRSQTKSKSFKKILGKLIEDTTNGMFLSTSMDRYRSVFGDLFINIVRVGENSGTLIENLQYLAVELKKKKALQSKVRGAMIYPSIILVATIGIVGSLMLGVFPKILPVFSNLNIELPITTRILIALSKFLTAYTAWIAVAIFLLIVLFWFLSHYEFFKYAWHHIILKTPIIGKISQKVNSASISRVMGLLLKSGVQIIEAVDITAHALDNRVYRQELMKAEEKLRRGEYLSVYLKQHPHLFLPILTNMIEVGENTGNLTDNLDYLSQYYEEEVDEVLKNLSSIIEPILLLTMGLLVGFIALSVITPIYKISQSLTL